MIGSNKKLLMAAAGGLSQPDPLIWSLGDRENYDTVSSISLPSTLLEDDTVFVATAADAANPDAPTGYTVIGNAVGYLLSYKVMTSTPDTSIDGLTSASNVTHTAFAFRGLGSFSTSWYNNDNSGLPQPNATPAAGVSTPSGGVIIFVGFLDDDMFLMVPPTQFKSGGRSYSSTKGASVAASYTNIPVGSFGGYTGGFSDSWHSIVATFNSA